MDQKKILRWFMFPFFIYRKTIEVKLGQTINFAKASLNGHTAIFDVFI